jgi:hypothetical protein
MRYSFIGGSADQPCSEHSWRFAVGLKLRWTVYLMPDGPHLEFVGVPGRSYEVQSATAISGSWDVIATRVAPSDGRLEHTDVSPPKSTAFYRAHSVP